MENRRKRPTNKDFQDAGEPFLNLIERLQPGRVVITSLTTWKKMPPTQIQTNDEYKQAYQLKDGSLTWCLAVPHPASRKKGQGFKWNHIGAQIEAFRAENLPTRC
jgi:hypothetical protein